MIEDQEMIGHGMHSFLLESFGAKMDTIHWEKRGASGIAWYQQHRPDIVLLDIELPDLGGFEVLKRLQAIEPKVRVLVVTNHINSVTLWHLRRGGIMGVIDKGSSCFSELKRAIDRISEWQTHNSRRVDLDFQQLMGAPNAFFKLLTPREQELMGYFGLGWTNDEIAQYLHLAVTTIQGHRRNIMQKLKIRNATSLMRYALNAGFVHAKDLKQSAKEDLHARVSELGGSYLGDN